MHLLLHPSAWSDRADDEAENDILAMQVPTYIFFFIMWIENKYLFINLLIYDHNYNFWNQEASNGVQGAEFRPPPG